MVTKAKPRGLGKGLGALLMDEPDEEALSSQSRNIAISSISPNPYQPRQLFREEELDSLIASIRKDGILTPVLLRPHDDAYQLIAGERRWRAAQAIGLAEIPAIIRDVSDAQALELAIIENEQRDNLTVMESAQAYQRLINEFDYTQQKVSEQLGISRSQVSNTLRLLRLPLSIQQMVATRQLEMGHARPLVGMDAEVAEQLAHECIQQGWSARRMEQQAKQANKAKEPPTQINADADILALEDELSRTLSLKVKITHKNSGGGEMRIRYGYAGELDQLLKRLRNPQ